MSFKLGFAPSLVIFPEEILLLHRLRVTPFPYTVKIPALDPIIEDSTHSPLAIFDIVTSPPPITTVSPETLPEADGFDGSDFDYSLPCMNTIVENPGSSSDSVSFTVLAIDTTNSARITCNSTTVTSENSSKTRTVSSEMLFKRTVRVCSCATNPSIIWQYIGEEERPLMALGYSGRRAIWVETISDYRGTGGLVGFTIPCPLGPEGRKCGEEDSDDSDESDIFDYPFEQSRSGALEKKRPTRECFQGKSSLRRLSTPPIPSFGDITALGFDESTATVVAGDSEGRV